MTTIVICKTELGNRNATSKMYRLSHLIMENINPEKRKRKSNKETVLLLEQRQKYRENCIITGRKTKIYRRKKFIAWIRTIISVNTKLDRMYTWKENFWTTISVWTFKSSIKTLSLIHIWRCRRPAMCRSRWSPYH